MDMARTISPQLLQGRFFAARVHDKTTLLIDPADYAGDASLKGAFVGGVLESDLSEEEKQRVNLSGNI